MKRVLLTIAAGLLAISASAANIKSGLEPGKRVGAFDVVDVSGPNKGTQLCYRCKFGKAPVVAAFIKSGAREAGEVVAGIQRLTEQHKDLKAFVVFMGGPELKGSIEKLAAEKKVALPLTFLPQGPSAGDIQAYQINPEASSTVMLWNRGTVRASFANVTKAEWGEVAKAAESMVK